MSASKLFEKKKMNSIFSLAQLLAYYSLLSSICASPSNYPLVYNPYYNEVYYEPQTNSKNIQSFTFPVLVACPATSDEEKNMNTNHSLDHKALFVRKFYVKDDNLDDIIQCEDNLKLAVVIIPYETKFTCIEFGYEVYFENSILPEKSSYTIRRDYQGKFLPISGNREFKYDPILAEDRPLNFLWVKRIRITFDEIFWKVISIKYSIHRSAEKIDVKCDNHNLGQQFLGGQSVDLEALYSTENKKNILNEVKIPEKSVCQLTENGCLEKYNLLMPHHFQSSASSTVSCSNLIIIPIWYEVSKELLDYSEKFLTAISEITSQKLTVTSGGYQILSLQNKNQTKDKVKTKRIYLDGTNDKVPVPRIIYKVVRYELNDCFSKIICWFEMVIVIHNEPEITQEKLCTDKCEMWGWDSIQYLSTADKNEKMKSEFIYCCQLSKKLREALNYNVNLIPQDLNLKQFPYDYNKEIGKIAYKDMQGEFETKMKELFKL